MLSGRCKSHSKEARNGEMNSKIFSSSSSFSSSFSFYQHRDLLWALKVLTCKFITFIDDEEPARARVVKIGEFQRHIWKKFITDIKTYNIVDSTSLCD